MPSMYVCAKNEDCPTIVKAISAFIDVRVSNSTGQSCLAGQRDISFSIVPGQRDNGTSSKSCHGPGRAGIACQNLGQETVWPPFGS